MKRLLLASLMGTAISLATQAMANDVDIKSLEQAARAEGAVNSVGMPDSWANWKDTWVDLGKLYGLKHMDTDMSSAQEIAKFAAEKDNASADIGDVGAAFGPIAVQQGVTQAFKPSTWEQIPAWAKDADGNWMLAYTGSIAFIVNKQLVKDVLAAAIANGGNESNIQPGLDLFAKLAEQGRLGLSNPTIQTLEKGEVEVGIVWDFNGLSYRDQIDPNRFEVLIPSDGSVISGYSTIINKYAKNPNAAKLAREYILSDAGQINLAKGNARPIRAEHLTLPAEVQAKLLPNAQYAKVQPIKDPKAWEATAKALPQLWQEHVIINMQ